RSGTDALLLVRQSNRQRTVAVADTGGDTTTVAVGFVQVVYAVDVKRGTLSAVGVEGVTNTELEAGEVRGLVHDHVVPTDGVNRTEGGTDVGLAETLSERIDGAEVLGADVGLTTDVELTPGVATQAEGGVTTEQTTTLLLVTGAEVEAAFDLENSLQAVTHIFGAAQAPAVAGLNAIDHASLAGLEAVTLDLLVADTTVQDTVQGHGRFCLSNAGEAERKTSSEQSLFHVRNLRRFE